MIVLQGNPQSTNHIYKISNHRIYMTHEGISLKESYQWQAKTQWEKSIIEKDVEINVKLFFKDNHRRDWDNWHKLWADSLTGIVWKDDSQIKKATIEKNIDKKNPRIEIEIKEI